jgi:hypothetical protein
MHAHPSSKNPNIARHRQTLDATTLVCLSLHGFVARRSSCQTVSPPSLISVNWSWSAAIRFTPYLWLLLSQLTLSFPIWKQFILRIPPSPSSPSSPSSLVILLLTPYRLRSLCFSFHAIHHRNHLAITTRTAVATGPSNARIIIPPRILAPAPPSEVPLLHRPPPKVVQPRQVWLALAPSTQNVVYYISQGRLTLQVYKT